MKMKNLNKLGLMVLLSLGLAAAFIGCDSKNTKSNNNGEKKKGDGSTGLTQIESDNIKVLKGLWRSNVVEFENIRIINSFEFLSEKLMTVSTSCSYQVLGVSKNITLSSSAEISLSEKNIINVLEDVQKSPEVDANDPANTVCTIQLAKGEINYSVNGNSLFIKFSDSDQNLIYNKAR